MTKNKIQAISKLFYSTYQGFGDLKRGSSIYIF